MSTGRGGTLLVEQAEGEGITVVVTLPQQAVEAGS